MSAAVQQVFVLAGVIVGALASYLASAAMERARWRRQMNTRWDTARMEAYTEYAHAVKSMVQCSLRLCAQRGMGSIAQPVTETDGLAALAEAEANRGAMWEKVLLVGTPATVAAGRRWHECAWRLELFARGLETGSEAWVQAMGETNAARAAFYAQARSDLGVPGESPMAPWPRRPIQDGNRVQGSTQPR